MKRMFTATLTLAALAATPATQALSVTPKQAAKIAKQVFEREIRHWNTQGPAGPAGLPGLAGPRGLSGPPGITAENANPMAYALIHRTGTIDEERSFGISQADVFLEPESGTYCFAGSRLKTLQVTLEVTETTKPQQPGETFPVPPPGSWNSIGYQPDPPATPGSLSNPIVIAGLGKGLDCPAGTEFYVQGFSDTRDQRGYIAFFLSLVL